MELAETYTAKELASVLMKSDRAIQLRGKRESWPYRQRAARGGGCEYLAHGLPEDVRLALAQREARQALDSARPGDMPDGLAPGATPPEPVKRRALDRFAVVGEFRRMVATSNRPKLDVVARFLTMYEAGALLPEVRERLGKVSRSSLYGWDKSLRENGDNFLALADRKGKWATGGHAELGRLSERQQEVFLKCWLRPTQPSVQLAYDMALPVLKREGLGLPSYVSVWRFANRFKKNNSALVTLMREGEKATKDLELAYATRDSGLLEVGDVLVADGHKLNFQVLHPDTGKPCRMILVLWFDWASRMPVGWQIMPTEDRVSIHAALRHAIISLGKIPRAVYLDNGRAFKSKFFTSTMPDFREDAGLYVRLGIEPHFAAPYNARAKVVERFFHTFNEQLERMVPSYTGSSIQDKPARLQRNEKFHQNLHAKQSGGWVPNLREAAYLIQLYAEWYASKPHDGLHGDTPGAVFAAGRGPGVDAGKLALDFMWRKLVKPRNCRVTLYGIEYESDALLGRGEKVWVHWDTSDMTEVYLYDQHRILLGTARPVEALHPLAKLTGDELAMAAVTRAIKRQQNQMAALKKQAQALGGSLEALPWEKRPVLPAAPKAAQPTPMKDDERKRLEAYGRELEALEPTLPTLARPAMFIDPCARFEWVRRAQLLYPHQALSPEDAAYADQFETEARPGSIEASSVRSMRDLAGLVEQYGAEAMRKAS